ncbi:type I phosphomannose isomerase catalytic subunit [Tumebacillus permanentifrigoris]|uniref:Mannose-6-phosphate isomerase n=1 Tax=Tumebacillus permanentifrigoris TaxID=378543 RepID=A0A316DEL7_9BACL|nr:type I phosphomannose isomerase catalytic subunit [Tumebacillus permanentifrigoris]PWK16405.1 mannose-6-phosphate isomerase type 1 [Tumebacillus permanentifrigoris]
MRAYPVKFAPVVKPRPWGGDRLKALFQIERAEPIGEYWVLSGLAQDASVVVNGAWAGKTLVELVEEQPAEYLGGATHQQFPLLIKFLEAREHLSVQIHPDDQRAREWEQSLGKTEAWYILDHDPGAKVIYGHSFPNPDSYWRAVRERRVVDFLQERPIARDQLVFVPARTLHALLAGTILIEIQQTSDVTYRVYDWDRVDAQGNSRELHLDQAAQVMRYGETAATDPSDQQRYVLHREDGIEHERLLTCSYFTIEKLCLDDAGKSMQLGCAGNPDVVIIAEGEGYLETEDTVLELRAGDTVLVPTSQRAYRLTTTTRMQVLRTFY